MHSILIVEDNAIFRHHLTFILEKSYQIFEAERRAQCLSILEKQEIDLIILDIILPDVEDLSFLAELHRRFLHIPIIILSSINKSSIGAQAIQLGAKEFILKEELDTDPDIICNTISNILALSHTKKINQSLISEHAASSKNIFIPEHPAYQDAFNKTLKAAKSRLNIMINGPTGSGKDVLAKYIRQSLMPDRPLIVVNSGAICDSLSESELFGHEKASFTGADHLQIGKIEMANEGILFLDEIGNMRGPIQEKILRVIEDKKVVRVGSVKEIEVDFLLISATNKNLALAMEQGQFRSDLFYRLNQFRIEMPSIAQYPGVIPQFVHYFVNLFNEKYQTNFEVSLDMLTYFSSQEWPGGIRELKNRIQTIVAMHSQGEDDFIDWSTTPHQNESHQFSKLDILELNTIKTVLKQHRNHITNTAKSLGIPRQTLHSKIKKYQIDLGI